MIEKNIVKYLIIIEDKINSRDHSEQLKRYKEFAEEKWNGNNKEKPICIYLKTGNECKASLEKIEEDDDVQNVYHTMKESEE